MSSGQIKTVTVEALVPNADHREKRGFFVKLSSGLAALVSAATDVPYGVILDGENTDGNDAIAISVGNVGSVRVKVAGSVTKGGLGQLTSTGEVIADAGTGARVLVCVFLEAGSDDELVEAILIKPVSIGNAVTLGNTNGEIGGLTISGSYSQAEVTALRDKVEELADDVRALYVALQAQGAIA